MNPDPQKPVQGDLRKGPGPGRQNYADPVVLIVEDHDDTREMLDSLLLHIGTAYETEVWGQVRKFIVLDVINDLLALTIRNSLLHLMSAE